MALILGTVKFQAFDDSGEPLSGGLVYSYSPGTTTPLATYPTVADAEAGTNANSNPVVLDSRGEANIVTQGVTKIVLKDSAGATVYTVDSVQSGDISDVITTSGIFDPNGNEIIKFSYVASAINELSVTNGAAGNGPTLSGTGGDTSVSLNLQPKGFGTVKILGTSDTSGEVRLFEDTDNGTNYTGLKAASSIVVSTSFTLPAADGSSFTPLITDGSGGLGFSNYPSMSGIVDSSSNEYLKFTTTASAVNELTVANAATGTGATLSATGGDANIDLNLQAKGIGAYNLKGTSTSSSEVRLFEDTDNGTNYIGLKAPTTIGSNVSFTLPSADGTANTPLFTNGSGTLSFTPSVKGVLVPGVTDGTNVATGYVGEYVSSSVSGVATTSGVTGDVTSISLTAGDWDVYGLVTTAPAAGTTTSDIVAWVSTTSATPPNDYARMWPVPTANAVVGIATGILRVSISSTTTVYLSRQVTFAVSTMTTRGVLQARRVR